MSRITARFVGAFLFDAMVGTVIGVAVGLVFRAWLWGA
jgi:hypothetical protein